MCKRVACSVAVAVAASLASLGLSATALATPRAGARTFHETYPIASGLCARTNAGLERHKLKHYAADVVADCSALESSFSAAQGEVLAMRAAVRAQIAADRAAITAACPAAIVPPQPPCTKARGVNDSAIRTLHAKLRAAARHYYSKVELARHTFWKEIHALPGESHLVADKPIPTADS